MMCIQRAHPLGAFDTDFGYRELLKNQSQNMADIFGIQVKAAHKSHRDTVLFF